MLCNWVETNVAQQGKQGIRNNKCKNKLGCACYCTNTIENKNRLIKPSIGDCSKPGIRYRRSWKENLRWSNSNICKSRGGTTPRTKLTGKRRLLFCKHKQNSPVNTVHSEKIFDMTGRLCNGAGRISAIVGRLVDETKNRKMKYSLSQGVNPGIINGAKFKNLRNRRGVKQDEFGSKWGRQFLT